MIEKPTEIRKLRAGAANQVFLLRCPSTAYVFKWFCHDQTFGLDRAAEFELQRLLANVDLAPEVVALDAHRWVLQRFIAGKTLAESSCRPATRLKIAAQTLARIHAQKPTWQGSSVWQKTEYYAAKLGSAAQQQLHNFRRELEDDSRAVLCHLDLSFGHILLNDDGVTVVDWEYAGWGDRLTDIASTIEINQLTDQSAQILSHYYEQATGFVVESRQLEKHRQFVRWLNQQWSTLLGLS